MDDLDRYVRDRDKKSPGFAKKMEAAYRRRLMMHRLAEIRRRLEVSQTTIAALMKTSPAMVSRAESGANVTFDTFEKYAVALVRLAATAGPRKRARTKKRGPSGIEREIRRACRDYMAFA